jgi:hypothetical protein
MKTRFGISHREFLYYKSNRFWNESELQLPRLQMEEDDQLQKKT